MGRRDSSMVVIAPTSAHSIDDGMAGGFLSTGIPELNDLLTRDVDRGIGVPEDSRITCSTSGIASSTLVIEGTTGAGKSVLATVLASNLHLQPYQNAHVVCVYFSFAQSSKDLN